MKHHYNKEELIELKRKYDMKVSKEAIEEIKHTIDLDREIERLQHNQEVSTKWEIKLTQKNTKLKEENKRLKSIIKEAREYIEINKKYAEIEDYEKNGEYYIDEIGILEILEKVEENK